MLLSKTLLSDYVQQMTLCSLSQKIANRLSGMVIPITTKQSHSLRFSDLIKDAPFVFSSSDDGVIITASTA